MHLLEAHTVGSAGTCSDGLNRVYGLPGRLIMIALAPHLPLLILTASRYCTFSHSFIRIQPCPATFGLIHISSYQARITSTSHIHINFATYFYKLCHLNFQVVGRHTIMPHRGQRLECSLLKLPDRFITSKIPNGHS